MDSVKESNTFSQDILEKDIAGCEHAEIAHELNEQQLDKKLSNNESDSSTALDSDLDNRLPNIESNTVIDESIHQDIILVDSNDTHNVNEIIDPVPEEGDFGSFDSEGDDDDFGSFDGEVNDFNALDSSFSAQSTEIEIVDNDTPILSKIEEAVQTWEKFLNQLYNSKQLDSFTKNASKSIRQYVLEDASESLHVRLTWDSVTRYMDDDTGIPKVKWYKSEIEKLHLEALSCKRSVPTLNGLTMINTTSAIQDDPELINNFASSPEEANYTIFDTNVSQSPSIIGSPHIVKSNNTTPTTEKRSSVFGFTSLSRLLPNLTKSDLPKSPTSPVVVIPPSISSLHSDLEKNSRSPINQPLPPSPLTSSSSSRHTYHNDLASLQGAMNHMNTEVLGGLKRANTVSFSSRYKNSSIMTEGDLVSTLKKASPSTTKPRSTSFYEQQPETLPTAVTDLFDLNTIDFGSISQKTTSPANNQSFKPLTRTLSSTPLLPTPVSNVTRRSTLPVSMHSEISQPFTSFDDDEFGDFAAQDNNPPSSTSRVDDLFGDFFGSSSKNSTSTNVPPPPPVDKNTDDDPFDLDSVMMMSTSHSRSKSTSTILSPMSSVLSPTLAFSLTPPKSPMFSDMQPLSPVTHQASILSPTMITKDVPVSSPPAVTYDPFDFSTVNSSSLASVFSMPANTVVTDQPVSTTVTKKEEEDDDDWGDWES